MKITRRQFIKTAIAGGAGLLVPRAFFSKAPEAENALDAYSRIAEDIFSRRTKVLITFVKGRNAFSSAQDILLRIKRRAGEGGFEGELAMGYPRSNMNGNGIEYVTFPLFDKSHKRECSDCINDFTLNAGERVLEEVNKRRLEYGVPPCREDPIMSKCAGIHSADMVLRNYFSHVNPEGQQPWDRLAEYGWKGLARENIAGEFSGRTSGGGVPHGDIFGDAHALGKALVDDWMASHMGHRENILDLNLDGTKSFTATVFGAGVALENSNYFFNEYKIIHQGDMYKSTLMIGRKD